MAVEERTRATTELTLERLLELRRPVDVVISPDGEQVAFAVSAACSEKGKRPESHIWIGSASGVCRQATRGPGTDILPRWSRGGALAFASDRDHPGRMSLYLLGPGPGEARPLGDIAGSVEEIRWAPDGGSLLVLAADLGADRAGIQAATKIQEADAKEAEDPKVTRPFQAWRRLFRVDAETGETAEVGPEGVHVFEFDWDGGSRVVAVCSDEPSESAWYSAYIALVDIEARTHEVVYRPEYQVQTPRFAGDGGSVCFVEGFCSDRGILAAPVFALDLESREVRELMSSVDVSVLVPRDERRLWFGGLRGLETVCGSVSLDGDVEELWSGDATLGMRFQPKVSADEQGRILVSALESPNEPPEVVVMEVDAPGEWRQLTELNAGAPRPLEHVRYETRTWTAEDGLELEGLLLRPQDADGPLPCVVNVHGGPTGAYTHVYAGQIALWAQAGYAVFLPNPRGSAGRGQDFARANHGDMGGGDLRDILAGIDDLVEDGIVDTERVGIMGGSYGGFMAAWAITQTDRFAASIPIACVSDWLSFHLTTNIGRFDELFLNDDPYDSKGDYASRSPVVQARRAKTPTLIIHGEEDLCTPVGQAKELYQALVEAGAEVELALYPREGHGLVEREHIVDAHERMKEWFGKHLAAS